MKIGDKVRFLNDIGGGIITGFQDKNIVLVKDNDGFEVPTLKKDCVVINTNEYNIAKVNTSSSKPKVAAKPEEIDIADKPITFKPKPIERKGGDDINLFLAYTPINIHQLSHTNFETYLINDSNYTLQFIYLSKMGKQWKIRYQGTAEPNTKLFLEEFSHENILEIEEIALQSIAYKEDKKFTLKSPTSIELKINGKLFYKLHSFKDSDFFEGKAIIYPLVKQNHPQGAPVVTEEIAEEIEENLMGNIDHAQHQDAHITSQKQEKEKGVIELDLHASEILETTVGMTSTEILSYQVDIFRKTMKQYSKKKGQKIIVIHGKGEGILRNAIINELKRHYPSSEYQDASFQEYGFGATLIKIKQ